MREKCGIFGVFNIEEAARFVYPGLWALQHRGQESSGIVSSNGEKLYFHKGMGLVAQVYKDEDLDKLPGTLAVGHNRYSTSKGSTPEHNQPVIQEDRLLALAHNGNLPSTSKLEQFLKKKGIYTHCYNDSELMYQAVKYYLVKGATLEKAVKLSFPLFTGVFCLLVMTKDKMVALRDQYGVRPLSLGKLNGGFVVSSESCAFDMIGAKFLRDVAPGEMIVFSPKGMKSYQLVPPKQKLDIFEFVYFARPDSVILGKRVNEVRKNLGRILAQEAPINVDIIIPVPDSAIPAALGYAQASGIPFDQGLIKNRYIHRTFIQPAQKLRQWSVEMKLNPLVEILKQKKIAIVDDSIVRGTTLKKIVEMLKKSGAREVHVLISSPPVRFPDFYGIDTPTQEELIASSKDVQEIRKFIGADSLNYLSYRGMVKATGLPESKFCSSCFSGEYPVDIGEKALEIVYPEKVKKTKHQQTSSPSSPFISTPAIV